MISTGILAQLLALTGVPSGPPQYHVLLIGVPQPGVEAAVRTARGYFPALRTVDSDLGKLAAVLEDRWSVPKQAVTIDTDPKDTTKAGILGLIESKLIEPCKPDDVVFFGFVGHGLQIPDLSKRWLVSQAIATADVAELDPSDPRVTSTQVTPNPFVAGDPDPSTLISGAEIGAEFAKLKKITPNVTLAFDCCHSGVLTRGAYVSRGAMGTGLQELLQKGLLPHGQDAVKTDGTIADEAGKRGLVSLSAADSTQCAYEDEHGGVFTNALVQALNDAGGHGGQATYQQLSDEIRALIETRADLPSPQTPQIEGDTRRAILSGAYIEADQYFHTVWDGSRLKVNAGQLQGWKQGFLIGILGDDQTGDHPTPAYTALVGANPDFDECTLVPGPNTTQDLSQLGGKRAVLLDGKPDGSITVNVEALEKNDPELAAALKNTFVATPLVGLEASQGYQYYLSPTLVAGQASPGLYDLKKHNGDVERPKIDLSGAPASVAETLHELLLDIARSEAVQSLAPPSGGQIAVQARLVPVTLGKSPSQPGVEVVTAIDLAHAVDASDLNSAPPDDGAQKYGIEVRLQSKDPQDPFVANIALLNVNPQPTGEPQVQQSWPGTIAGVPTECQLKVSDGWMFLGATNSEYKLVKATELSDISAFSVDPSSDGSGLELFKVFATDRPEDFSSLLSDRRGGEAEGAIDDLNGTISNFAQGKPRTRGQLKGNVPKVQRWCVAPLWINVKNKNG